jgi:type IV pilus assembly protein PilA
MGEGSHRKHIGNSGFTLVELMVTVAIVGILAMVAIPNYLKYVAKARQSEAKIGLSALFVAQKTYASEFQSYTSCLPQTGFWPGGDASTNYAASQFPYYAVGFSRDASTSSNCGSPTHSCDYFDYLNASKCTVPGIGALSSGGGSSDHYSNQYGAQLRANSANTPGWPKDADLSAASFTAPGAGGGFGSFKAAAAGNISYNSTQFDIWTIDDNKVLVNTQSGI